MKIAIIVRLDLGMRTGKIAVQVGHASVMAYRDSIETPNGVRWFNEGQKKIVLKVPDERIMREVGADALLNNLRIHRVFDFGLTQVEPDTETCIVIGPDEDEKIEEATSGLKLL